MKMKLNKQLRAILNDKPSGALFCLVIIEILRFDVHLVHVEGPFQQFFINCRFRLLHVLIKGRFTLWLVEIFILVLSLR